MDRIAWLLYVLSWIGLFLGLLLQLTHFPVQGTGAGLYALFVLLFLWCFSRGPREAPRYLTHALAAYILFETLRVGELKIYVGFWVPAIYLLASFAYPLPRAFWIGLFWGGVFAAEIFWAWPGPLPVKLHFLLSQAALLSLTLLLARFRELYGQSRFWRDQALTDPLTGLANRRAFEVALEREAARVQRGERPFSLILLDLDDFKLLNDRYGHAYGDQVLRRVARHLEGDLRQGDLVARWGGEEFALLLPATGEEEALRIAERLRKGVEGLGVTASLGVGAYRGGDPALFFRQVDEALYRAKALGKNRVVPFSEPGTPPSGEPL